MHLELRGLTKRYGDITVLDDVTLSLPQGATLVVLGPSGGGKTTLLRLVAGFDYPSRGEVWIDGRLVSTPQRLVAPHKRAIGLLHQELALWPHMNIAEHLTFVLKGRMPGRAERQRRILSTLEQVGLEKALATFPGELSGGERQRLALARAIVHRPALLLLDEPFSNLDPPRTHMLRGLLKQLRETLRVTIMHVTHDQRDARALGDSVVLLDHGRLVQRGTLNELQRHPANAFVAEFVAND